MLSPHTPDDITNLIRLTDEVSEKLRDLRSSMQSPGPGEIELNSLKAQNFLFYLSTWAEQCKSKHRIAAARAARQPEIKRRIEAANKAVQKKK